MYVKFETLPDHSRIWIYQANRKLTAQEKQAAEAALQEFCEGWVAHQQPLKTSFSLEYDQFVILATDEDYHLPSGCSIDSSVRALKELGSRFGIDLFDRTKVAFLDKDAVVVYPLSHLKELFESGKLAGGTITFNNLVPSIGDLKSGWRMAAEKTWLAKYLPNSALVKN